MDAILNMKQKQISKPKDFRTLLVYDRARKLRIKIYDVAKELPDYEGDNLAPKMRKCVTAIPSNMAEGQYVSYKNKKINHFDIVIGKCGELRTLLDLCLDDGYITESLYNSLDGETNEISKMCFKLKSNLYSE